MQLLNSQCDSPVFFKLGIFNLLLLVITGIAVLVAAGFFGYMLALLQQRVKAMFSSQSVCDLTF